MIDDNEKYDFLNIDKRYYGKWIAMKGFNDNTVVASSNSVEDLFEEMN